MNMKDRIDEHISHTESNNEFGTIVGIFLSKNDYTEFKECRPGLVNIKEATFYKGIRVKAVKGLRSYLIIDIQ